MNAVRPWLHIGKYRETLNEDFLSKNNIGAVLQLAEAVPYSTITAIYLPVDDGVPLASHLLKQGVDFVLSQKKQGKKILIACGAGISRSASYAIAALKEAEDLSLLEATEEVAKYHPQSFPHPALWESLCDYYKEDVSLDAMLKVLRENK